MIINIPKVTNVFLFSCTFFLLYLLLTFYGCRGNNERKGNHQSNNQVKEQTTHPDLRENLQLKSVPEGTFNAFQNGHFTEKQLDYPRVHQAYVEKTDSVKALLYRKGIHTTQIDLYLRLFKKEEILEVWAKPAQIDTFKHLVDYPFCTTSGSLGPKRKEGDRQIPEGFYHISYFNPNSNYHLSLKINYPNRLDRKRGHPQNPGGEIFIHGNCVTIGCIPITDGYIKELYILAVEARNSGSTQIPVHIFPARLDQKNWQQLKGQYSNQDTLLHFWNDLREGYQGFQQTKTIPDVRINDEGYVFH